MSSVTRWFRSGHPNRSELVAVVVAIAVVVENVVSGGPLPVQWAVAGFVATLFVLGPVAHSAVGVRLHELARSVGSLGRVVAIVSVAVGLWGSTFVLGTPGPAVNAVALGSLSGVVVFAAVEWVVTAADR